MDVSAPLEMENGAPAIWPSVGEYLLYDGLLYGEMTGDGGRNAAYRAALSRLAPGKVVLDVGTGADAILARIAAECGARRVYAIETQPAACASARRTIRDLGMAEVIEVIEGDALAVEKGLEPVDVCVSEIVGSIASAEGAEPILAGIRERSFARGAAMIPTRIQTRAALVELPPDLARKPAFNPLAMEYVKEIFELAGRPFDIRLCLSSLDTRLLMSSPAVVESIALGSRGDEAVSRARGAVERDGLASGIVMWPVLELDGTEFDSMREGSSSWAPAFVPLFDPPRRLRAGAAVEIELRSEYVEALPDYTLAVEVVEDDGHNKIEKPLPRIGGEYGGSPFYARLFGL